MNGGPLPHSDPPPTETWKEITVSTPTISDRTRSWQHRVARRDARQTVWSAQLDHHTAVAKAGAVAASGSNADFDAAVQERQDAALRLADAYDQNARAWYGSVTYWAMKYAAEGLRLKVRSERASQFADAGTRVTS